MAPVEGPIVQRRPQAAFDIIECANYLATDSLDTALRFLDAVEVTFAFVAKNPEIGPVCRFASKEAANVRYWQIKEFQRHLMFYVPLRTPIGIDVVRVLHGARDLEALFVD